MRDLLHAAIQIPYAVLLIYQQSWNLVSADFPLTIIPALLVYLLGQRLICRA